MRHTMHGSLPHFCVCVFVSLILLSESLTYFQQRETERHDDDDVEYYYTTSLTVVFIQIRE